MRRDTQHFQIAICHFHLTHMSHVCLCNSILERLQSSDVKVSAGQSWSFGCVEACSPYSPDSSRPTSPRAHSCESYDKEWDCKASYTWTFLSFPRGLCAVLYLVMSFVTKCRISPRFSMHIYMLSCCDLDSSSYSLDLYVCSDNDHVCRQVALRLSSQNLKWSTARIVDNGWRLEPIPGIEYLPIRSGQDHVRCVSWQKPRGGYNSVILPFIFNGLKIHL